MANKIGWCDRTWNPVWGCLNHCEYCYARKMAKRFSNQIAENDYYIRYWGNKHCAKGVNKTYVKKLSDDLKNFTPTFLYGQYSKKFPKKPQRIFVGSMSEIYYWKDEWLEKVLEKVKLYPQHTFQFLTKHSQVYLKYVFPTNCWLGITITKDDDLSYVSFLQFAYKDFKKIKYISFEPLLDKIIGLSLLKYFKWIIIGVETGNRKGKVIPKREWIENIVSYCRDKNIPIYLKDSLKDIYPVEIKEFPGEEGGKNAYIKG